MKEMVKKLAEASGWSIPEDRMTEILSIYKATADDTRPVREADVSGAVPANLFESE